MVSVVISQALSIADLETGPDEWEKYVLKKFEKGVKEVFYYGR